MRHCLLPLALAASVTREADFRSKAVIFQSPECPIVVVPVPSPDGRGPHLLGPCSSSATLQVLSGCSTPLSITGRLRGNLKFNFMHCHWQPEVQVQHCQWQLSTTVPQYKTNSSHTARATGTASVGRALRLRRRRLRVGVRVRAAAASPALAGGPAGPGRGSLRLQAATGCTASATGSVTVTVTL